MSEQRTVDPKVARHMESSVLCHDATDWLPTLERGDAEDFAEWLIDSVIDLLLDDPAVPRRTRFAWELMFADLRRDAERELGEQIDGKTDRYDCIDEIVKALDEEESGEETQ